MRSAKSNPSKYKCPGCSLRSCSLPCVNSHKKRTASTGKRPVTSFVPIAQFDHNLLISDYNMFEDVKRVAEWAQRMRVKLCGYSHFKLPFSLKNLKNAEAAVSFKWNKFISWTIEWRFHSTDVVLVDRGIHENTTLSSVIENHLKSGPRNHSLKQFCEEALDSLNFFIRKYHKVCCLYYYSFAVN
ncbi:HIT-type Zinc finger family protein [Striga asiatica]|uniref:HIT-type Zinc finger family protein n=1 Tax=Striga asiatica TaxID=4170 RepID=A0A5A7QJV8_STRAF|nr:HIT-type Zinc finger family protein [Striga asiatica]